MFEAAILIVLIALVGILRIKSVMLQHNVEMLTARLDAIQEQQIKHEHEERRRRNYEVGFFESKLSVVHRNVEALTVRLDAIEEPGGVDPKERAPVKALVSSFRR